MPYTIRVFAQSKSEDFSQILTEDALSFLAFLHKEFSGRRLALLEKRKERQERLDAGEIPTFLPETESIRSTNWRVAECPRDLLDRRVEITGPTDAKMMINALNSGAKVFMADLEDATSPTWTNVMEGQINLRKAVRKNIDFTSPEGKVYALKPKTATLVVRPRGWHLEESHILCDSEPISASLCDFGLFMFHNSKELVERGSGPYFYLPKLESHEEARLWADVFHAAENALGIPHASIRSTVLVETILAAFEMEEILYELKDSVVGLNAGRWDYIFSIIKKFAHDKTFIMPDRKEITMTVPFLHAYTSLLVRTCHKRGAHAIGGMSAFIPNRKDLEVTDRAIKAVRCDKKREAHGGFDGTWVAHPDLVPVALEEFDQILGAAPHQKHVVDERSTDPSDLLNTSIEGSSITLEGIRTNIHVALQYMEHWLGGLGAVAIHNLMEDAATAEISRAQLWQWVKHQVQTKDGTVVTPALYESLKSEALNALLTTSASPRLMKASKLLDELVLSESFCEFLTVPAYGMLS